MEKEDLRGGSMGAPEDDAYLKERVEKQIEYHARMAAENRRRFRRLATLSMAATTLTPLLVAIDIILSPPTRHEPVQLVFGVLPIMVGVVAAVATASLSMFKHKEGWLLHRSICEALRRECYLFRNSAGRYAGSTDPHALFVTRAEELMEAEGKQWEHLHMGPSAATRDIKQL
jgi:hypothetical protein